MSADLAFQKVVRVRLVTDSAVTALVPSSSILDRNERPVPMPSIIIGEGQAVEGDRLDRRDQRLFMDLHVWVRETGLTGAKAIAGAIRTSLHGPHLAPTDGYQFGDCRVSSVRYLRDPDGEASHAVVTLEALVSEVAP
jgi:hypothetical protein